MSNEAHYYQDSLSLTREQLELELVMCVRNLLSATNLADHRDCINKFYCFSFRLRELKNF